MNELLARLPHDRTLRVLEIGGGTGALTSHLLPGLPNGRTEYVFTDLSNHFFNHAQQKFLDYPFVRYERLDIEHDPREQGFSEHFFDLIVASHVLHATANLRQTLEHIGTLLAPQGAVLCVEYTRPGRWGDLVFGLTKGWWRFADFDVRRSHPLLGFPQWQQLFEQCGFSEVVDASKSISERGLPSAVIVARGGAAGGDRGALSADSGNGHTTAEAVLDALQPAEAAQWLIFADRGGLGARLAALLRARPALRPGVCRRDVRAPG